MQKLTCLLFFIFAASLNASAQKDSIKATIIRFFDGLSELNPDKLKAHTTADFLLLEDGAVWNMDSLTSNFSRVKKESFKRINTFSFIDTREEGNTAWVSYFNTADITFGNRQRTIKWLESAVLVKHSGNWKIQLLHSTHLKP